MYEKKASCVWFSRGWLTMIACMSSACRYREGLQRRRNWKRRKEMEGKNEN
jgi:hypothetical protein